MINPEQIPDAVFEAFKRAWSDRATLSTKECFAAALNAWPGAFIPATGNTSTNPEACGANIILPLTETPNG